MKNKNFKILLTLVLLLGVVGTANAWGNFSSREVQYDDEGYEIENPHKYSQVAAQHILVKTAAEAVQIKKELDKGGSFEFYAAKYSLCPSGQKGGYLGYFERGQMVPEFENKAFSMKVGEISNPIRTNFGWHIIKVVDKR
ncbi:MAG: peptidyl-prolyl cis-trans isomerase [Alphaproteobacteria bacterium]|nr:peptidyl-prolyl cis-trans isomerase [Alphaproteobacteria bacterium]